MYLVDSSVWIDALRTQPGPRGQTLRALQNQNQALLLCGPVLQEILQGCRDEFVYARYQRLFAKQPVVQSSDPMHTYAEAGRLYARCRWKGITPRSPTDCLIAQIAIEHRLTLLHDDEDYVKIARIEPRLKLA